MRIYTRHDGLEFMVCECESDNKNQTNSVKLQALTEVSLKWIKNPSFTTILLNYELRDKRI
jgi:hypothetical protein